MRLAESAVGPVIPVSDLAVRGVSMEIMDGDPFLTDERGIADLGEMLIAWFRDPDGQVLAVFQPV
jgi:hypothetical protein